MNAGRLVGGIVLIFLGIIFTATIIGAIIGIPLLIIGIYLLARSGQSNVARPAVIYPTPQPSYYPPPPPGYGGAPPVTVNVQQAAPAPGPLQVMRRCRYCQTVYPETLAKCPSCGATF
jgi:hypothetical protein